MNAGVGCVPAGDVPGVGQPYVTTAAAHDVTVDQVVELLEQRPPTSLLSIGCLLQASEYQTQGNELMQRWIDSMVAAVSTDTGMPLAAAPQEVSPGACWAEFATNIGKHAEVDPGRTPG
jgi:hypothetical protein